MKKTATHKETHKAITVIVNAFADAPFPYGTDDVDQEGHKNLQLMEDLFRAQEAIFPQLHDLDAYKPIFEIYASPYEMTPEECLYVLPRLLVLVVHLHKVVPEYTAEILNFLNLSFYPSSRKRYGLEAAGYDAENYQRQFILLCKQSLSLLTKQHYRAIVKWLLLVQEWGYDTGFYQKDDVDLALAYWRSLVATGL